MCFQQRTDWDAGKERIYYRFHILLSSHYNAYVINIYGRFVLYFHLHYQVIPKIAYVFSKPYEVRKQFELKYAFCRHILLNSSYMITIVTWFHHTALSSTMEINVLKYILVRIKITIGSPVNKSRSIYIYIYIYYISIYIYIYITIKKSLGAIKSRCTV